MKNQHIISLIFGVTGHRDLRYEDISQLDESVKSLLLKYKNDYPHTKLILLSALAEGADMLVARVARGMGVTLHVVLPYEEDAYLDSFDNEDLKEEFKSLKKYASNIKTLECDYTQSSSDCYQYLGEYIADSSHTLIALWDGVDNGKRGGTSAIVKYQRAGFEKNRFDTLHGNTLFIIKTPRISNPDIKQPFEIEYEYLSQNVKEKKLEEILCQVDKLN